MTTALLICDRSTKMTMDVGFHAPPSALLDVIKTLDLLDAFQPVIKGSTLFLMFEKFPNADVQRSVFARIYEALGAAGFPEAYAYIIDGRPEW